MESSPDPTPDSTSKKPTLQTDTPLTLSLEPIPIEESAAMESVEFPDPSTLTIHNETPLNMSIDPDAAPKQDAPAIDVDLNKKTDLESTPVVAPVAAPAVVVEKPPTDDNELDADPEKPVKDPNVQEVEKMGSDWFAAMLLAIRSGVALYINVRVHAKELDREHDALKLVKDKAYCAQVYADYQDRLKKIDTQLETDPEKKNDTVFQTGLVQTTEALLAQIKSDVDAGIITEEEATQQIEQLDAALKDVPEALKTSVASAVTDAKQTPPTTDAPQTPTPLPSDASKPSPPDDSRIGSAETLKATPDAPTPPHMSEPTPTPVATQPIPAPVPTLLSPAAPQQPTSLPLALLSQSQAELVALSKNPIGPIDPSFDPAHTGPVAPAPLVPKDKQEISVMPSLKSKVSPEIPVPVAAPTPTTPTLSSSKPKPP